MLGTAATLEGCGLVWIDRYDSLKTLYYFILRSSKDIFIPSFQVKSFYVGEIFMGDVRSFDQQNFFAVGYP